MSGPRKPREVVAGLLDWTEHEEEIASKSDVDEELAAAGADVPAFLARVRERVSQVEEQDRLSWREEARRKIAALGNLKWNGRRSTRSSNVVSGRMLPKRRVWIGIKPRGKVTAVDPAAASDLIPGRPYRVRARVPLDHVRAVRGAHGVEGQKVLLRDLEHRFAVAGFVPLAVLEDPTDPQLFHAVARLTERACDPSCAVESGLSIVGWEEVDEPPEESSTSSGLDPGLSEDEVSAIRSALAHDTNPRHLYGLSDTLAPFFPVASSVVRAKATMLETQAARNARDLYSANRAAAESAIETAVDAYDVEPEVVRTWLFRLRPDPVHDLIGVLREAGAAWPDVEEALRTIRVEKAPWASKQLLESLRDGSLRFEGDRAVHGPTAPATRAWSLRAALERYAVQTQVEGKSLPLSVARDECRRVACDLISGRAQDVGTAPRPIQDVGRALVSELGYGVLVVRLPKLVELLPPSSNDGFVSPTALQLALGASKPIFSRALHPERIGARLATLDAALPKDAQQRLQALNMMERAERALERRRWVEWYRRVGW